MKNVFIHPLSNNLWKVIDKATGETIDHINDVMIFNGEFKRYNGIKGWHGILSEEMNMNIIDLMSKPFNELLIKPRPYYPRIKAETPVLQLYHSDPIKKAGVVHFKDDKVFIRFKNNTIDVNDYLLPWKVEADPWEEPEDYEWEEYDDDDLEESGVTP